jgi:hypothetical protein
MSEDDSNLEESVIEATNEIAIIKSKMVDLNKKLQETLRQKESKEKVIKEQEEKLNSQKI